MIFKEFKKKLYENWIVKNMNSYDSFITDDDYNGE